MRLHKIIRIKKQNVRWQQLLSQMRNRMFQHIEKKSLQLTHDRLYSGPVLPPTRCWSSSNYCEYYFCLVEVRPDVLECFKCLIAVGVRHIFMLPMYWTHFRPWWQSSAQQNRPRAKRFWVQFPHIFKNICLLSAPSVKDWRIK